MTPLSYICEVCHFPTTHEYVFRDILIEMSEPLRFERRFRCLHCEALEAQPLWSIEGRFELQWPRGEWMLSITTFVQSPRSKGGTYCDYQHLAWRS